MKANALISHFSVRSMIARFTLAAAVVTSATLSLASDYKEMEVETQFRSGLDRTNFSDAFKTYNKDGYRIVDIETYRSGRSTSVSTIWTKLAPNESWQIKMSAPIAEFLKAHEDHVKNGYSLIEFEVDRNGATLHFSGIWVSGVEGLEAEFHFGMESLAFSNLYGEMADRGFRLIDFEAYEANGKYRNAAVWIKNAGKEVRFYRGIGKNKFGEMAASLDAAGYRLLDIEGYDFEGKFVFAGEWVKRSEWHESKYAFDLLADEFYNKNATYVNDGYRITEFETYEDNGVLYYAGSWLKGNPANYKAKQAEEKPEKKVSLEEFRTGTDW